LSQAAVKHLIVLPAYNEEESLAKTVGQLQSLPDSFELLVVNDGSRDRTGEIAQELSRTSRLPLHVVDLPSNSGIGVAVQTGYLFASKTGRFKYVIQFDADGQHDAAALPELVKACDAGQLDLCVGSRFLSAEEGGFRSTFSRRVGIRFFAWLIRMLTGTRVTDPTSGLRCAGPRAWRRFARSYPEDYPEPETLYWCARNRFRIGEIPVFMHERQGGVSSIRWSRAIYYMVKVTVAILLDCFRRKEQ